jgi:F-type H+-transporting ATPase subunit delta
VDPAVLGGMRTQVGDEVTDNTVVNQLRHLEGHIKATA